MICGNNCLVFNTVYGLDGSPFKGEHCVREHFSSIVFQRKERFGGGFRRKPFM
jgi:hypothetical protein